MVLHFLSAPMNAYCEPSDSRFLLRKYIMDDGMSNNNVTCISQDRFGQLWIGTTYGLNRFDGYQFYTYYKEVANAKALKSNKINTLFTDSEGNVWVGTVWGGISKYNFATDNFTSYYNIQGDSNSIASDFIYAIAEDSASNIWFATPGGLSVLLKHKNTFLNYNPLKYNSHSSSTEIIDLTISGDRIYCLNKNSEISCFYIENGSVHWENLEIIDNKHEDILFNRIKAVDNVLYVVGERLVTFNLMNGVKRIVTPSSALASVTINASTRQIIFGTANGKLLTYSDKSKCLVDVQHNSTGDQPLLNTIIDKDGNIWSALGFQGLAMFYKAKSFTAFNFNDANKATGLSAQQVSAVYYDKYNNLWVGYHEGNMDVFNESLKKVKHYNYDSKNITSIGQYTVFEITEDLKKNIYIGTYAKRGLQQYMPKTNTFKTIGPINQNGEPAFGYDIRGFCEDSSGIFWVASHGKGLFKYNPQTDSYIQFKSDPDNLNSLITDWLFDVHVDSYGIVWVADAAGINRMLPGQDGFTRFQHKRDNPGSISNNTVTYIYEDYDKNVWFATDGGLSMFCRNNNGFITFNLKDGLSSDAIRCIIQDEDKNLWVSTTNGINKISYPFFDENYNKLTSIKTYYKSHGLHDNTFLRGAGSKSKEGKICFGGSNGLTIFHPQNIKDSLKITHIFINDFSILNTSIRNELPENVTVQMNDNGFFKHIKLHHKYSVFGINFTIPHFIPKQKLNYSYRLFESRNLNSNWINIGDKTEITFANILPGTYTFQVRGKLENGPWSKPASIQISVLPPWWKTWIFKIVALSIFILIILVAYNIRIRNLKERQRNLENKVRERTLELKNANTILEEKHEEILLQQEAIIKQNKNLKEEQQKIEEVSRKLHDSDQAKIRFFMNISHEFRTPLTLILGPLESMMKNASSGFDRSVLLLINRNANRLLRLVNQLLDFRRLELNVMKLNAIEGDVIEYVKTIFDSFNYMAYRQSIEYKFKSNIKVFKTWYDPEILEKIIYNLISNAFKYTPENGYITMQINFLSNHKWQLNVSDTGAGIKKEALDAIFDRFYTTRSKHQKKVSGSGIGLSLTKELVEIHKGAIKVESKYGQGTVFSIEFDTAKERLSDIEINPGHNSTEKIDQYPHITQFDNKEQKLSDVLNQEYEETFLLIDDNQDILYYLNNILKGERNLIFAQNGNEGFKKAYKYLPDLIISDVMMPEMDGMELCNKLKTDINTSHIPVILLTAKAGDDAHVEGLYSGADAYIQKPFNEEVFKANIKNLLKQRQKLKELFQKNHSDNYEFPDTNKLSKTFIDSVISIVHEHMSDPEFSVDILVDKINLGRTVFYKKIKSLTGLTANEFLKEIKLNRAYALLEKTDLNVSQVCYQVGFQSPKYFTRVFKEKFNIAPSLVRTDIKNKNAN